MSKGVNKCILVGNLGADPETRFTPSGTAITSIRIATSESWKDKETGEAKERTEWHRVEFFGKLAEIAGEYLKKGGQVYIEGKIRTDEYEKDGVKRYSTKVIADQMQMLGSKGGDSERQAKPKREPVKGCPQPERDEGGPTLDDDDPIPFAPRGKRNHWE